MATIYIHNIKVRIYNVFLFPYLNNNVLKVNM